MKRFFLSILERRLTADQFAWLQTASDAAAHGGSESRICSDYTAASKRLGKRALQLDSAEKRRLAELDRLSNIDHWGADEAGRAVILLSSADRSLPEYASLVHRCYELGDSREQQSWLRGLGVLPHGGLFLSTAVDSCRTNIVPLFEAIACENPYPSIYFPDLNFNQMILKCLFNRIAISRVIGLPSRLNPELQRMADHYASELKAAGRQVPADIHLTRTLNVSPERSQ